MSCCWKAVMFEACSKRSQHPSMCRCSVWAACYHTAVLLTFAATRIVQTCCCQGEALEMEVLAADPPVTCGSQA